jgi:N-acetylglucosaminyldiphosphoundecaprenol N-acetyl-beta-D-mannosaminyltransferase
MNLTRSDKAIIFDSEISLGTYGEMVENIMMMAERNQSSYVCCANVHMVVEAHKDPSFSEVLNNADLATPDGAPIAKAIEWLYGIKQDRVAGMDLVPDLLAEAEKRHQSVYFLGDTDEVLDLLREKVEHEFPDLRIAGTYSPPFRKNVPLYDPQACQRVNESGADLLFVALGCPKQEKWMAAHKGEIQACMLGIGNAFRTYLGILDRAPSWMQKLSLEWLYRLYQEPGRLWKRYLHTNSYFVYMLAKKLVIKHGKLSRISEKAFLTL